MLDKLIKYDMRSLRRILLPLTLAIIAASLLGALALRFIVTVFSEETPSDIAILFTASTGMFLFLNAIAIVVYPTAVVILVMVNFYKNLYTDEGYLTFTLPVKKGNILLSKFITAMIWSLTAFIVTAGCVFIIILFGTATDTLINTEIMPILNGIASFFGSIFGTASIFYLVQMLASSVYIIVQLFLAITIGSIVAKRYKVLASIGIYYALNIATSIIINIVDVIMMLPALINAPDSFDMVASSFIFQPLVNSIIYIGFAAAAYILTHSMMKNKLNLP